MAHYKRKRPRAASGGYYSTNALRHRLGKRYNERLWLANWPRHWDIQHHTRPARTKTRRLERAVVKDIELAWDAAWPVPKKPHVYYW